MSVGRKKEYKRESGREGVGEREVERASGREGVCMYLVDTVIEWYTRSALSAHLNNAAWWLIHNISFYLLTCSEELHLAGQIKTDKSDSAKTAGIFHDELIWNTSKHIEWHSGTRTDLISGITDRWDIGYGSMWLYVSYQIFYFWVGRMKRVATPNYNISTTAKH